MVDSVDDKKKIGVVNKTGQLDNVQKSEAVKDVKATGRVGALSADMDPRGPTREMTAEERENMLAMVKKEAESMFANSKLSKDQAAAIELAVQKTVDASIIVTDEENLEKKASEKE